MSDVLIRVKATGRLHRGTLVNGRRRTDEACNLDDAQTDEIVGEEALQNAELGDLCENPTCFPPVPDAA